MYIIYSDGNPVYSPNLIQHGYTIISGKITKELNKAGSLEFTIPKTNPMYSKISKLKSIITVEDYGEEIWRGRVLDETRDFYGNKHILCEGELAYLNDSYGNPTSMITDNLKGLLNNAMDRYLNNCSDYRIIKMGEIHAEDPNMSVTPSLNDYTDLLDWLTKTVLDTVGGYLIVERRNGVSYLDYYENFDDRVSDQVIEFGKNLIDFEEYIDASNIYTYSVPLGKQDENGKRINISSVNDGKTYIFSSSGEQLFGKIYKVLIYENEESPSKLLKKAKKELDKAIEAATTITINAVDLKDLGVDVSRIDIGWMYPVISIPHDISSNALCSKLVLDLSNRANNEYTFGMDFKSLSERSAAGYNKTNQAYLVAYGAVTDSSNLNNSLNRYQISTESAIERLDQRISALEEGAKY